MEDVLAISFPGNVNPILIQSLFIIKVHQRHLGSFYQYTHADTPMIWTLSEPYGAKDWWPCKQSLSDKIDSIDILVTCPSRYRDGSNGVLVSETQNGNNKTYHWKSHYPISTYLVAIAVTNYSQYSDYAILSKEIHYKFSTTFIPKICRSQNH
jgi:aminopeptidase N